MSDDILFEVSGGWGLVTLNREKALNALTFDMAIAYSDKLAQWAGDDAVKAVLIRGAGEKAFCAGGDIRWLHDTAREDAEAACQFFRREYELNTQIFRFPKPYVALIDGIVMGGGVGVSVHGDFRVAGPNTLFAMPETGIGLIPDVGGGHFMPRLPGGLGLYYALTGARAKAADCLATGIATHYADDPAALEAALLAADLSGDARAAITAVLDSASGDPGEAPIAEQRAEIDALFTGHDTLDGLIAALKASDTPFAQKTLETLGRMSPTSLYLAFGQMQRGGALDFEDVMRMEFRLVRRIMEGHDIFEGVRAQIIDKDRNPQWQPASLEAVSAAEIAAYFEPLGAGELHLP